VKFNYRQINLQDIAGRELLYRGPVGLLPLTPLMRQEEPPEVVLDKCTRRLQSEVETEDERSILYVALAALSSLRFPKDLILKVLEVSKLENLPLFDGIREEWEARGRDEGIVEAIMEALEAAEKSDVSVGIDASPNLTRRSGRAPALPYPAHE